MGQSRSVRSFFTLLEYEIKQEQVVNDEEEQFLNGDSIESFHFYNQRHLKTSGRSRNPAGMKTLLLPSSDSSNISLSFIHSRPLLYTPQGNGTSARSACSLSAASIIHQNDGKGEV